MENIVKTNGKRVAFTTLGCKVNQYDSDAMRSLFIRSGGRRRSGHLCDQYLLGDERRR